MDLRTPAEWFYLLLPVCLIGPYLFGVRPRSVRDWRWIAIAIAFLAWLLLGFESLRSLSLG